MAAGHLKVALFTGPSPKLPLAKGGGSQRENYSHSFIVYVYVNIAAGSAAITQMHREHSTVKGFQAALLL